MEPQKKRIAIVADSACDLTRESAAELGVSIVSLHTTFSDGDYLDGIDLTPAQFYEKIAETGEIPKTSQPSPADFFATFEYALAQADEVICLTISSHLSGTNQSAEIGRGLFDLPSQLRIHVVDTLSLSHGEQILVRVAASLAETDMSAADIVEVVEALRPRVRLVGMFGTLDYLQKGGRLPAGVAMAGRILSVKPVISAEKGKIALLGLAKGTKNGKALIEKGIKKFGGADYDWPVIYGYTGLTDEALCKYLRENEALYGPYSDDMPICNCGAVIGTHVGPGAISFSFISNK